MSGYLFVGVNIHVGRGNVPFENKFCLRSCQCLLSTQPRPPRVGAHTCSHTRMIPSSGSLVLSPLFHCHPPIPVGRKSHSTAHFRSSGSLFLRSTFICLTFAMNYAWDPASVCTSSSFNIRTKHQAPSTQGRCYLFSDPSMILSLLVLPLPPPSPSPISRQLEHPILSPTSEA